MADPLLTIDSGENLLLNFTIRDGDGEPVPLEDVAKVTFSLLYEKPHKQLKSWTYDAGRYSSDMEQGDGAGQVKCELLASETATPGLLRLVTRIAFLDSDYFSSLAETDVVLTRDFILIDPVTNYGVAVTDAEIPIPDPGDSYLTPSGDNYFQPDGESVYLVA